MDASAGCGDAAGGEIRHRQLPCLGNHAHQLIRRLVVLRGCEQLFFAHHRELTHFFNDLPHVLDSMDDIARAGFALGADHGRAFGDAPQGLAQIAGTADERRLEGVLVHVVLFVGGRQDLGFVDVINADFLQDLRLGEMADTALGHHRNGDCAHDLFDQLGIGHARDAALGANDGRHALQRHDRDRSGRFGDFGLLDAHYVHDDAALEHLGQPGLQAQAGVVAVVL